MFGRKSRTPQPPPPPAIPLTLEDVPDDLSLREVALRRSLEPVMTPGTVFGYDEEDAVKRAAAHYLADPLALVPILMRSANDLTEAIRADRVDFDLIDSVMGHTGAQLAQSRYKRYEWITVAQPVTEVKRALGRIAQGQLEFLATVDRDPRPAQLLAGTQLVIEERLRRVGRL